MFPRGARGWMAKKTAYGGDMGADAGGTGRKRGFTWSGCLGAGCLAQVVLVVLAVLFVDLDEDSGKDGQEQRSAEREPEKRKVDSPQPSDDNQPFDAEAELAKALADLDALVGLEGVKAEVRKIVNKEKVDAARRAQGLPV